MAVRRSTKPATKSDAAEKQYPFPTIVVDGEVVPDVIAIRAAEKIKWPELDAKVARHFPNHAGKLAQLSWKIEVVKDPKLLQEPTVKNVVAMRDEQKLRWGRIAVRVGKTEGAVRKMYEEGTNLASETDYVGKGRKFKPMEGGAKPVGYKSTYVQNEDGTWVPASGSNGTVKRAPRRSKTSTEAAPKRTVRRGKAKAAPAADAE